MTRRPRNAEDAPYPTTTQRSRQTSLAYVMGLRDHVVKPSGDGVPGQEEEEEEEAKWVQGPGDERNT